MVEIRQTVETNFISPRPCIVFTIVTNYYVSFENRVQVSRSMESYDSIQAMVLQNADIKRRIYENLARKHLEAIPTNFHAGFKERINLLLDITL